MNPARRAVVSIVGAGLVVLLVMVIILVFGVIPLPDFPSLADQPDPSIPGTVAYVGFDGGPCLFTVPASGGETREVWCGREYVEFPMWSSDGLLVLNDWTVEPTYLVIDPVSGTEVDRLPIGDQGADAEPIPYPLDKRRERADGAIVLVEGRGNGEAEVVVRLSDGSERMILSVTDAPSDYYFHESQWSPDGEWVLITDNAGRLLIVGANGTPDARVLVDDLQDWGAQAAWYIPGNDTYTVDIAGR